MIPTLQLGAEIVPTHACWLCNYISPSLPKLTDLNPIKADNLFLEYIYSSEKQKRYNVSYLYHAGKEARSLVALSRQRGLRYLNIVGKH